MFLSTLSVQVTLDTFAVNTWLLRFETRFSWFQTSRFCRFIFGSYTMFFRRFGTWFFRGLQAMLRRFNIIVNWLLDFQLFRWVFGGLWRFTTSGLRLWCWRRWRGAPRWTATYLFCGNPETQDKLGFLFEGFSHRQLKRNRKFLIAITKTFYEKKAQHFIVQSSKRSVVRPKSAKCPETIEAVR